MQRSILRFAGIASAVLIGAVSLQAQGTSGVRLTLEPGSHVSLEGTSTLHPFHCSTDKLEAYIDVDPAYRTKDLTTLSHPIVSVKVQIPVKSLTCGNGKLESNMFKTLHADENPTITYVMTKYDVINDETKTNSFVAKTTGSLTVSGTERPIEMRVESVRAADGAVTAQAEQSILMTDFNIKPPTFMLGALRVGNQITIKFTVKATQANVAAAVGAAMGIPMSASGDYSLGVRRVSYVVIAAAQPVSR